MRRGSIRTGLELTSRCGALIRCSGKIRRLALISSSPTTIASSDAALIGRDDIYLYRLLEGMMIFPAHTAPRQLPRSFCQSGFRVGPRRRPGGGGLDRGLQAPKLTHNQKKNGVGFVFANKKKQTNFWGDAEASASNSGGSAQNRFFLHFGHSGP